MHIEIDSGYLDYVKVGEGIPLLFIHGYPLSRRIWDPQMKNLSDVANIITFDLRGHGESYPFEGPYSMNMLADDCKYVLDTLHIQEKVVVCGLSMGGYITLALYRKYPDLFRGMILTSTRAAPDSAEGKSNRDAAVKTALQNGIGSIADQMLPKMLSPNSYTNKLDLVNDVREIMANTSVEGVVGSLQGMKDRPDSIPMLAQIKCPVMIIHGIDDQLIPIRDAEILKQNIPNSKLVRIANAGHLPNLEQPEIYNAAVREFLLELS